MSRTGGQDQGAAGPDMQQLIQDWATLWQSELVALAADREAQEGWRDTLTLWARLVVAVVDGSAGRTGPAAPSRTPAVSLAPDARDPEIERLSRLVSALESRLSELEQRSEGGIRR